MKKLLSTTFGEQVLIIMKVKITALVLGMLLIGSPSFPALAGDGVSHGKGQPIKVMTRNLYIGVDTDRILQPGDILLLTAEAYQVILQTNFPERAEALADEIAGEKPDLIGIQEASLMRIQSPSNLIFFPPDAEDVIFDYLDILLSSLETRGLHYQVAAIVQGADVELPMYAFDEFGDIIGVDDLRVTDRVVILARNDVDISNPISRTYAINAQFTVEGLTVEFTRGFVAVDAMVRDRLYRFVSTHLEERGAVVDGEEIQALQASELVAELAGNDLPVILVGDFNSSPQDNATFAYSVFRDAGYVDVRLRGLQGSIGRNLTCCQEELLRNEKSVLYESVDHIFVLNPSGESPISSLGSARIVGDKKKDKTVSGMWPSDHAGVVARIPMLGKKE